MGRRAHGGVRRFYVAGALAPAKHRTDRARSAHLRWFRAEDPPVAPRAEADGVRQRGVTPSRPFPSEASTVRSDDVSKSGARRVLVARMAHRPFDRWLIHSFRAWRERSVVRRRLRRYVASRG